MEKQMETVVTRLTEENNEELGKSLSNVKRKRALEKLGLVRSAACAWLERGE